TSPPAPTREPHTGRLVGVRQITVPSSVLKQNAAVSRFARLTPLPTKTRPSTTVGLESTWNGPWNCQRFSPLPASRQYTPSSPAPKKTRPSATHGLDSI